MNYKSYLISLPARQDRRRSSLAELSRINIDPIIINGVDHHVPHLGCKQAHIRALEYAYEYGDGAHALIIEDDILIQDCYKPPEAFESFLNSHTWDIFYFYSDKFFSTKIKTLPIRRGPTFCNHFYLVNYHSIKKLIDVIDAGDKSEGYDPITVNAGCKKELFCYCSNDNMVCQNLSISTRRHGGPHLAALYKYAPASHRRAL